MYFLSFRVHNRELCFGEMIGAVHQVLGRSEKSAELLHRKAVDLYQNIAEFGKKDEKLYGKANELKAIKKWINEHKTHAEKSDSSQRFLEL